MVEKNVQDGTLRIEGAELYYEVRGSGPALVMIAGAGGDAGFYEGAAEELADAFTVITYDRRGNSRSTGRVDKPMSMAEQADDARAVIDALAGGKAIVYGSSLGGLIALELAARHPDALTALIVHEPPAVNVLADREESRAFLQSIHATYSAEGPEAAGMKFALSFPGEGTYHWPDPLMERFGGNVDFLFQQEWNSIIEYQPNLDALKESPFPIVMSAGSADRGYYFARPSAIIAREIGAEWVEFPGIHMEGVARPAMLAAAIRVVATGLYARVTQSIPDQWSGMKD